MRLETIIFLPPMGNQYLSRGQCGEDFTVEQFSFEDKRQALEALHVKVIVTEDGLDLCGIIPLAIDYDSITTAVP